MDAFRSSDFPYEKVPEETRPEVLDKYWRIAKGLQAVDGLVTSEKLDDLSKANIECEQDFADTRALLRIYYDSLGDGQHSGDASHETREADFVAIRIAELLSRGTFLFSPEMLKTIHRHLFQDLETSIYHPGEYKTDALQKRELILNGDSVVYTDPALIDTALRMAFEDEMAYSYGVSLDGGDYTNLAKFVSRLWQVHPFNEGNTRMIAVFVVLYLNDLGFDVTNEPFESHSRYFRDTLVRAIYRNPKANVLPDLSFLAHFLELSLSGKHDELHSRDLMVDSLFEDPTLLRNVPASKSLSASMSDKSD